MNIFRDINALPAFHNAVVTIGSFDGVHRGHQRILRRIKRLCTEYEGESVVITFDKHPRQVLSPWDESIRLLTTTDEKLEYLAEYDVDNVILISFTVEFSHMGPREYVERFLIGTIKPKCLVVGYDHRFGRDRQGNFPLLQEYANQGYFELVQIPKQEVDHIGVSSTRIRQALWDGNVTRANRLLHHPYRITGTVVKGRRVGRSLGYPTANVKPENQGKLLPAKGVYAAFVHLDHQTFSAMLYIGTRPTFDDAEAELSVEVHLLDFKQEIYGERIEIDLIDYIRSDLTLADANALREQIGRDEEEIRSCLANFVRARQIPSVAVVALNYNGRAMLEQYLPSLLNIVHPKVDIIVADNGSTDDSVAFVEQHYPDVQVLRLGDNRGYAEGYNKALANLDHDYYALINTDVEVTPLWVSKIVSVMENDKMLAACQPKIRSDRERERFEYAGACGGFMDVLGYAFCAGRILHTVEKDVGQYDHLRYITWASGAALIVRSELFHAAGGFDKSYFAHQEEIDLCWTLQRAGYRIGVVPDALVYHLGGATLQYDTPAKIFLNFRNNLTTVSKHLPLIWLLPVLVMRLFLDISASLHFVFKGQLQNAVAVLRAFAAFVIRLPGTWVKRRKLSTLIAAMRKGPSQVGLFRGSILFEYYILGHRFFAELSPKAHAATEGSRNPVS